MRLVTVELSKFKKRKIGDLLDLREEWCYLLKESRQMGEKESRELSCKDPEMESVMSYLRKFSQDEQFQILEEAQEKNRRDQAAREYDKFNEGKEEGKEEGKIQLQSELILKMLKKNTDIAFISEVTGLSEKKINKIKRQLT